MSNSTRAMALPMTARLTRCCFVGADRSADIEHDRFALQRRPQRRDRRPLDALDHLQIETRHRHQRAGIAGGDRDIGLALLHRVDGEPHRRFPAAVAQRLARLVVHADRQFRCATTRDLALSRGHAVEQRLDHRAVAEQHEFDVGMAGERNIGARARRPRRRGRRPWRQARCEPYPAWSDLGGMNPGAGRLVQGV